MLEKSICMLKNNRIVYQTKSFEIIVAIDKTCYIQKGERERKRKSFMFFSKMLLNERNVKKSPSILFMRKSELLLYLVECMKRSEDFSPSKYILRYIQ